MKFRNTLKLIKRILETETDVNSFPLRKIPDEIECKNRLLKGIKMSD